MTANFHIKLPSLTVRIIGISIVAGALIWGYGYLESSPFLPDVRRYIPEPKITLFWWMVVTVAFLLFHYKRDFLKRVALAIVVLVVSGQVSWLGARYLPGLIDHGRIIEPPAIKSKEDFRRASSSRDTSGWATLASVLWMGFFSLGGLGVAISLIRNKKPWEPPKEREYHKRGRGLVDFEGLRQTIEAKKAPDDPGILFGLISLPSRVATTHFLISGATGSGKTLSLRLLMQSVLPRIGQGHDTRAIIYDAKQDMLSILHGMKLSCKIVTLNPFDERCAAWNMAKDITSPATAQQIAAILVPEEKYSSNPFFSDAARALLTGVLIALLKSAPGAWTFRDVVYVMKSGSRLKSLLLRCPETRDLVEQYFSNEKTSNDVMATVATKMQRYEFIAAAWDRAETKLSLRDWLTDEYILVIGNDEATRTALDAINQVVFKRLTELVLAQTESRTRRTWVFLDEFRQAGKLDGINGLLTMGRSKGVCAVLGFQDIEGLSTVYGDRETAEIVGLCANKGILRSDSPNTAKWASSLFGEREIIEFRSSAGESSGSSSNSFAIGSTHSSQSSNSMSEQVAKRDVILPSEIMDLPPTSFDTTLPGFYIIPEAGAYRVNISGPWIESALMPTSHDVPNIIRRPDEHQYLRVWDAEDLKRLGLDTQRPASGDTPPVPEQTAAPAQAAMNPLEQIKR